MEAITRKQLEDIGFEYLDQDLDEEVYRYSHFGLKINDKLLIGVCLVEIPKNGNYQYFNCTVGLKNKNVPTNFIVGIRTIDKIKQFIQVLNPE